MHDVYPCTEEDRASYEPVGKASSKEAAAKLMIKYIEEETGDGDSGITAQFVTLSNGCYFMSY